MRKFRHCYFISATDGMKLERLWPKRGVKRDLDGAFGSHFLWMCTYPALSVQECECRTKRLFSLVQVDGRMRPGQMAGLQ